MEYDKMIKKMSFKEWKGKTWEDIFKQLKSDSDKWDLITALRGPDDGNMYTKALFTAFIRGKIPNGCDNIRNFIWLFGYSGNKKIYEKIRRYPGRHYLMHIIHALNILRDYIEEVPRLLYHIADMLPVSSRKEEILENLQRIREIVDG